MKAKIYEYRDNVNGTCFSDNFVRDYGGRGCFELDVEIPDNLDPYITVSDNIAIEYNGIRFMLNDVLITKNGDPYISLTISSTFTMNEKLHVYNREEKSTAMYL